MVALYLKIFKVTSLSILKILKTSLNTNSEHAFKTQSFQQLSPLTPFSDHYVSTMPITFPQGPAKYFLSGKKYQFV